MDESHRGRGCRRSVWRGDGVRRGAAKQGSSLGFAACANRAVPPRAYDAAITQRRMTLQQRSKQRSTGGALRCHCAGSDASPQRSSAVSAAVTEQVQLSQTAPHAAQQSLSMPHLAAHDLLCSYRGLLRSTRWHGAGRSAAHSHQACLAC